MLVNALFGSIEWFVMLCEENLARISLRYVAIQIYVILVSSIFLFFVTCLSDAGLQSYSGG